MARLLWFDVTRILAISMVVAHHVLMEIGMTVPKFPVPFYGGIELGKLGIIIFLGISGALLEINTGTHIFKLRNVLDWYEKRASKIYPAMWIAVVLYAMVYYRSLSSQTMQTWAAQITGMLYYNFNNWQLSQGGDHASILITVSWYVGLIMVFYLIFPLMHNSLRWNRILATVVILGGSVGLAYYSQLIGRTIYTNYPGAYLIFFAVGVVCASWNIYPHRELKEHQLDILASLSNLCLYIFLTHWIVIPLWNVNVMVFAIAVIGVALIVKYIDEGIKSFVKSAISPRVV